MSQRNREAMRREPRLSMSILSPWKAWRNCLLPVGLLLLHAPVGCVGTEAGTRGFASHPWRSNRLATKVSSTKAENSAELRSRKPSASIADDADQDVRLVSAQQETTTSQTASDVVPPEPSSSTVEAEQVPVTLPSGGVTLAQLESMALANNPTLIQSTAAITAEQGFYVQAGLYPNPQFGYLNNTGSRPGVEYSNGAFYSQEIPTAQKLAKAQAAAAVEINRYSWDNEAQRRRIVNDLRMRYYETLGAQEALKIAEKSVTTAEDIARIARHRFENGAARRSELLQAERHLQLVRLARSDAEDRLHSAWEQMATMIGCSPLQVVPLQDDLAEGIPDLERDSAWQELLNNSPQLRSTECDLGHAVAQYDFERANAYPNVTVQIVTKYDTVTNGDTISSLVALPIPFTNRNQGNIEKAGADIQAARAEIQRVQLVLKENLNASFRNYRSKRRLAEGLRTSILESVEQSLAITQRNYERGETGYAEVLAVQQEYSQSQETYVQSLVELHQAVIEIQGYQLTGGLNPAAIGSAIQNAPGGGVQRQRALLNEAQDRSSKQLMPAAQIAQ